MRYFGKEFSEELLVYDLFVSACSLFRGAFLLPLPFPPILQVKLITSSFFERISNQNSLQPATPRRLYYPPGDTQICVRAFFQQQLFVRSVVSFSCKLNTVVSITYNWTCLCKAITTHTAGVFRKPVISIAVWTNIRSTNLIFVAFMFFLPSYNKLDNNAEVETRSGCVLESSSNTHNGCLATPLHW